MLIGQSSSSGGAICEERKRFARILGIRTSDITLIDCLVSVDSPVSWEISWRDEDDKLHMEVVTNG